MTKEPPVNRGLFCLLTLFDNPVEELMQSRITAFIERVYGLFYFA